MQHRLKILHQILPIIENIFENINIYFRWNLLGMSKIIILHPKHV